MHLVYHIPACKADDLSGHYPWNDQCVSDFRSDRGNFEAEPAWLTGRIYEHGSYVPVSAVLQLYGHGIRKCGSDGTACYYFCAVPSTYAGQQRGGLNEKDTSLHCKIYGINFTGTDIPSADFICVL